jgi:hypothetical protein
MDKTSKALPKYTLILHDARKQLGLSFLEYAIAEGISHLSNSPTHPWCYTSKDNLAEFYEITTRGLQKIIKRLEERGLIERNKQDHLRTTHLWKSIVEQEGEQSSGRVNKVPLGVNKVHSRGEQSSYNHNNYHNNNHINIHEDSTKETEKPQIPTTPLLEELLVDFNKLFKASYRPTKQRGEKLRARLKTYTFEEIKKAMENMSRSPWHQGENERGWKADPDFLLRSDEQIDKWIQKNTPRKMGMGEQSGYQKYEDWIETDEAKAWGYKK